MLVLNRDDCELKINPAFADLLEFELYKARDQRRLVAESELKTKTGVQGDTDLAIASTDPFAGGVIFSFKDPSYSFEQGGYHPVEVCINPFGNLRAILPHVTLGLLSPSLIRLRSDWVMPWFALRPLQLRTKAATLKLPQMA